MQDRDGVALFEGTDARPRGNTRSDGGTLGRSAAAGVRPGTVIALVGGLGAGKTHWTKGLVAGFGSTAEVTSPTFGLVHEYPGGKLAGVSPGFLPTGNAEELIALGWDEYLEAGGVIVAEWGDKFPELCPQKPNGWFFPSDRMAAGRARWRGLLERGGRGSGTGKTARAFQQDCLSSGPPRREDRKRSVKTPVRSGRSIAEPFHGPQVCRSLRRVKRR